MQSSLSYLNSEDPAKSDCEEIEAAITLLLSLSSDDTRVDELVKAHYPFIAFKTEAGEIFFDLLLLSEAEKTQTASFDVYRAMSELVGSEGDRDKKFHECWSIIQSPGLETFQISGLINDRRIHEFLKRAPKTELGKPDLFKPQLTQRRFKSIKDKLDEKEKDRKALIEEIKQAKEMLQEFISKVKEENREKIGSYIDDSCKKLDELEKTNNKAFKKIDKSLTKNSKKINKEYDIRANELRETLGNLQDTQKEIEGGSLEVRKRRIENELKMRQLSRQLNKLENERAKDLIELEENMEKTKEELKAQFLETEENEKQFADKLEERGKADLEKIREMSIALETLEARIMKELEYLSTILGVKYKDGIHIHVPFYIHKLDNIYGVQTPIRIESNSGVKKTLKLMLADNLRDKMLQHVKLETESIKMLMENLVSRLSEETKLQKAYAKNLGEKNLLVSRSMLDKIEVGLYKLYEWEWINEKDYMVAQRCLVEKIDELNGRHLFHREPDPLPEAPLQQEISA